MDYVLETENLCKNYGHFQALDHLTMRVPKGAVYGLVGKNGAGKTTLIRVICGLQQPSAGSYTLCGVPYGSRALRSVRRRMGAVVETPAFYPDRTAAENLKLQFRVLGLPDDSAIPELLQLVGLEQTGKKKAGHFSLGMRQRLGIAVALCGDPDFLVLDEPANGLDPQGIVEMRELILKLNRERQITVLLSSHILDELSRLATHYGFVDSGRMVREISAEELEAACRKCARGGDIHRRPFPCSGPDGAGLPHPVPAGGRYLRRAVRHRTGGGPQNAKLQPDLDQGTGRKS